MNYTTLIALVCLSISSFAISHSGAVQHAKTAARILESSVEVVLEPVLTTGLTQPVFVTNAGDGTGRLFILEQPGGIKVLQPGGMSATVFLDLTTKVIAGWERGLLGMAFHPGFATNHRFFVTYTQSPDGSIVLAEYLASSSNPNQAETTEKVILTIPHPEPVHNGGAIEFGPDNFLYMSVGDGGTAVGPANPAQNKDELLGKILRIDINNPESPSVPYSSPPSNPFFGSIPGRDEIYALGFRNPWRISFDPVTGGFYVGDVGDDEREEIDIVTLGGNYGWSVIEGTLCRQPDLCNTGTLNPPLSEYTHAGGRTAVIGGYTYSGIRSSLPLGSYVYGDHATGEIFLLDVSGPTVLLDTTLNITSFGRDESGEIYVVSLGGGIYRLANPLETVAPEIQMSQDSYVNGETVMALEFRLKNPGIAPAKIEIKVWLIVPGIAPISILNLGADGSFALPPGFNQNLGPLILFSVDSNLPRGEYQFNSRMLDPATGRLTKEDLNAFDVQ